MQVSILDSIDDVAPAEWNALRKARPPFLCHEFLAALEHHGCVGEEFGWIPRHITVRDSDGQLIGAAPLYEKYNSYGEFVFDWAWAEAWQRAGVPYYPKLVSAMPYTPATGARLLIGKHTDADHIRDILVQTTVELGAGINSSSIHWLFTDEADTRYFKDHGWMMRLGCQFHWRNHGYESFTDFLGQLTSKKRKNILRERRHVSESDIRIRVFTGAEATPSELAAMVEFYRSTFDRKSGMATLNNGFFEEICQRMGEHLVLFMASLDDKPVAGAICFRSEDTLYGRHWGCTKDFHSLHFELCYYQGIEYCIREGLQWFEPGAQGEHKISRGFLPTPTWSAHRVEEAGFQSSVADFVTREERGMEHYIEELSTHSPYRNGIVKDGV